MPRLTETGKQGSNGQITCFSKRERERETTNHGLFSAQSCRYGTVPDLCLGFSIRTYFLRHCNNATRDAMSPDSYCFHTTRKTSVKFILPRFFFLHTRQVHEIPLSIPSSFSVRSVCGFARLLAKSSYSSKTTRPVVPLYGYIYIFFLNHCSYTLLL